MEWLVAGALIGALLGLILHWEQPAPDSSPKIAFSAARILTSMAVNALVVWFFAGVLLA